MFNYNDTNIYAGYIKQLLASFNLPTIKVVKNNIYLKKDNYYIYNNSIIKMTKNVLSSSINNNYTIFEDYRWNKKVIPAGIKYNQNHINFIHHLEIRNNYYDSYTHIYLGNYLRFLRDYKHFDLMSLYNCFSNELVNDLNLKVESSPSGYFKLENGYKIYKIPVKFFENYTIAIDSSLPVELVCGFYDKKQYSTIITEQISKLTYKKYNSLSFNAPILYTKLTDIISNSNIQEVINYEDMLYLFIKVPSSINSSIVVLEGNYLNNNDFVFNTSNIGSLLKHNKTVINFDKINNYDTSLNLLSSIQLLNLNSKVSHPFADRLLEYLLGNTIDVCDTTSDNIKRMQVSLYQKHKPEITLYNYSDCYGIWQNKYKFLLYALADNSNLLNTKQDILGYVDKDIEYKLGDCDIYDTPIAKNNISDTKVKRG
jgi:hypothetical protein